MTAQAGKQHHQAHQQHSHAATTAKAQAHMGGKGSGRHPRQPCGTAAGYRRHKRLRQDACQPCLNAFATHVRANYVPKPRVTSGLTPTQRKKRNDDRSRQIVREWKLAAGACVSCGLVIDERTVVCIDCDHIDPITKTGQVSQMIGRATHSAIRAELAKCQAICRNCHALRTHDKQHWAINRTQQPVQLQQTLFDN